MTTIPLKGGLNPVRQIASSSMESNPARDDGHSCFCIVEDVHGKPASRPLSFSLTPERSAVPVFRASEASPSSYVSPVFDNEMRLSGHTFPSPDQVGFSPPTFAPAAVGGAGVGTVGVVGQQQRSGTASHSRNGQTTLASSVSGLHVTQSGVVIPPIQGIPQPNGLPPPTPVQYAKVKQQRGKGGPKRSRLAVKGAFSNMTSVAVLQQVQPFQKKTRQVEAAGWSRLDYAGAPFEGDGVDGEEKEEGAAVGENAANTRSATTPSAMAHAAPLQLNNSTVHAAVACNARPSASHHSRTSSVASLTPSEAAMVAAAWEEDAAAAAAASAAASGHQMPCVDSDGHKDDEQDEWDRAEEEAMRVQAMMLQQQYMQQHQQQQSPVAPTTLHCGRSTPRCHSPVVVLHSDPTEEVAPYAVRTAASANRSPASTRPTPPRAPSPANNIYSAHRAASPAALPRSRSSGAEALPRTAATTAAATPARKASQATSPARPVGFAAYAEKGQQRRAEAERAQQARAAAAAGQSIQQLSEAGGVEKHEGAARRPRKMSVLPAPRGFDAFADRGHARRSEVEREAAARQQEEAANCTHVPRINHRGSVASTAVGGESRKQSTVSAGACTASASDGGGGGAEASAADAFAGSEDGAPRESVFDRLSREAEVREERQRQLQEKFTPSFVPQRVTVEEASAEAQPLARANRQGRNVFDGLYALAKKASSPPPPAAANAHGRNPRPTSASAEASEKAASVTDEVRAAAEDAATAPKKSKEEIADHVRSMQTRDEERRQKWAQRLAAQAAEEKNAAHHPTLDPKTATLADRARARYRVREEQKRQQEALKAEAQRPAKSTTAHREEGRLRQRTAPQPASSSTAVSESETSSRQQQQQPSHANSAATHTPARRSLAADFLAHQQQTEERRARNLEQLRLQRADEELRECTFRPQLNTASTRMAQRILVESYVAHIEDEGGAALPESYRTTSLADGEMSHHPSHSPAASARSRSVLHELRSDSPLQMPLSHQHQHQHQQHPPTASTEYDEEDDDEGNFALQVRPQDVSGAAGVPRSPEPLSAQLRNLEEMLREWKELERECSPMLRQRQQEGLVE